MPRIRTIKPELPESESLGRVSREARLCFILLFTMADDEGRLRGHPDLIAGKLYPYDDDAKALIPRWLDELESQDCIARYRIEGNTYIQITNWLLHQKIDKPSKSKLPELTTESRLFARVREGSDAQAADDAPAVADLSDIVRAAVGEVDGYKVPPCPYEAIVEAYAAELPELPQVAVLNDSRRRYVQARWREVCAADKLPQAEGLQFFRNLFAHVKRSRFLMGRVPPRGAGQRAFRADFDWLMLPTNFVKVAEGRYHDQREGAAA
jgi:hypothetical protein